MLGDIDSDEVQVRALDTGGVPVPAPEVDSWFRGAHNSAGDADVPSWGAATSTSTGNPTATNTDGPPGGSSPTWGSAA